jgi:hypothetical protein
LHFFVETVKPTNRPDGFLCKRFFTRKKIENKSTLKTNIFAQKYFVVNFLQYFCFLCKNALGHIQIWEKISFAAIGNQPNRRETEMWVSLESHDSELKRRKNGTLGSNPAMALSSEEKKSVHSMYIVCT